MSHEGIIERLDALECRAKAAEAMAGFAVSSLGAMSSLLNLTNRRLERAERLIMALNQAQRDLIERFNVATNKLAARLRALEQKIRDGGATAAEEAEFLAELGAVAGGLEATGADPDNPLPPATDPPVTPPVP